MIRLVDHVVVVETAPPALADVMQLVLHPGAGGVRVLHWGAPLDEYPDAAWDKVLALNVKGVFHLTRALVPQLEAAATAGNSPAAPVTMRGRSQPPRSRRPSYFFLPTPTPAINTPTTSNANPNPPALGTLSGVVKRRA